MSSRQTHCAYAVAVALLLAFAPAANAFQITLDLDTGFYDPTIVPTPGVHCPCDYLEDGARFAGFWAVDVGTPGAYYQLGHTHIESHNNPGTTGLAERQHGWTGDLQGNLISIENGSTFSVVSIDYLIRKRSEANPGEQQLPWSFGPNNVQMLLATSFDPTVADFESQWTAFDIDNGGTVTGATPWRTQTISGFDDISQLYLVSSGWVSFDNIVLEVFPANVPEPSTAVLLALGLVGLASRRRR